MSWTLNRLLDLPPIGNIVIVGGIHGAGKTTLCMDLQSTLRWEYLSPQNLERESLVIFTKAKILKLLLSKLKEALSRGESFIFEHTMSGNFIAKLLHEAQSFNFNCHLVYLSLESPLIAGKRINKRVSLGGHSVDESKINKSILESRVNFCSSYKQSSYTWILLDNSEDSHKTIATFHKLEGLSVFLKKQYELFNSIAVE